MKLGKQILTLQDLYDAFIHKRAVICPNDPVFGGRAYPAVLVMNMSGTIIYRLIRDGLYIYEKGKRG